MSSSSLRHYFRQLTAKRSLQYQKWLRLSEASRLMLNEEGQAAAPPACQIGYERRSQFSHKYSRLFSASPKCGTGALRKGMVEAKARQQVTLL